MRYRITFSKTNAMRYTSHLDLHRTWERTIRRAGLPLSYSQGFNPRPKINLASALPLGFTSECELIDFWLEDKSTANEVEQRLQDAVPPGIKIQRVDEIDSKAPKTPNLVNAASYEVHLRENIPDLENKIKQILTTDSLIRERRGKQYDLRPLINCLEEISPSQSGHQRLRMDLSARPGATGRPDEVLSALRISPTTAHVHRTLLKLKE